MFDQIAHVSQALTLEPGDIIFTGTPGGVGFAMKPPSFLKAGDVVRVEIDKIGALEAAIVPEPERAVEADQGHAALLRLQWQHRRMTGPCLHITS